MTEKLCPGCPGDPNETCCKPELRVQRWREQQADQSQSEQQRADRKAINDAIDVLEVLLDLNSEATPPRMLRRLGPMWWWRVRDIMHALLERSGRDLQWFYKERAAKPAPAEVLVYAYWPDGSRKLLQFATWPHRTDLPSDAVRFDIAWPVAAAEQNKSRESDQARPTDELIRVAVFGMGNCELYAAYEHILHEIQSHLDDGTPSQEDSPTYTLTFKTISRAGFDALDEFDGF